MPIKTEQTYSSKTVFRKVVDFFVRIKQTDTY